MCSVQALSDHKVLLEGTLLKPNMVSAGVLQHTMTAVPDARTGKNPSEIY